MNPSRRYGTWFALAALWSAAMPLFAFQWPVESPAIRTTFGSVRGGRYETGVRIDADAATVRPVQDGEVVFRSESDPREEAGRGGAFPSGLGCWVAVAHEDGLVSVYARLQRGSIHSEKVKISAKEDLAATGVSGAASAPGMELVILDPVKGSWVNPCLFLPPLDDSSSPQIRAAWIRRDGDPIPLGPGVRIPQGLCQLEADIFEAGPGDSRNAPFSVSVLLAGSEKIHLTWDMMTTSKGRIHLFSADGPSVGDFLPADGRMRVGSFPLPRGKMGLDIIVSDFAKNSRTVSFQVTAE